MTSEIPGVIGFALLAALLLWIGWKRGFFLLPPTDDWIFPIRWYHVIISFAIYFGTVGIGVPFLAFLLRQSKMLPHSIQWASWLNFLSSFMILLGLGIYALCLPSGISRKIWRRDKNDSPLFDLQFAAFAWLISFPLVIFLNQLLDWILHLAFHIEQLPDQLAVRFLKMTFQDPVNFLLTTTTIIILAPIIEETLFRGFLQSFIRQHLGSKHSILITSFCFSCFHYSPEQGIANISIIGSLFVLALFLGFVYDRRGSLLASIALHASFNAINVINLYFFGGFLT